jgi:hypothetical protein
MTKTFLANLYSGILESKYTAAPQYNKGAQMKIEAGVFAVQRQHIFHANCQALNNREKCDNTQIVHLPHTRRLVLSVTFCGSQSIPTTYQAASSIHYWEDVALQMFQVVLVSGLAQFYLAEPQYGSTTILCSHNSTSAITCETKDQSEYVTQ